MFFRDHWSELRLQKTGLSRVYFARLTAVEGRRGRGLDGRRKGGGRYAGSPKETGRERGQGKGT
jgi:hypothetical protein